MHGLVKIHFSLDNIFIRFSTKLHRQVAGITYCAARVANFYLLGVFHANQISKAISSINFAKSFVNFIDDTMI